MGTGLLHVPEIPSHNDVGMAVTRAQRALAPSLGCSTALSPNSAAWPRKRLQAGGLRCRLLKRLSPSEQSFCCCKAFLAWGAVPGAGPGDG